MQKNITAPIILTNHRPFNTTASDTKCCFLLLDTSIKIVSNKKNHDRTLYISPSHNVYKERKISKTVQKIFTTNFLCPKNGFLKYYKIVVLLFLITCVFMFENIFELICQ